MKKAKKVLMIAIISAILAVLTACGREDPTPTGAAPTGEVTPTGEATPTVTGTPAPTVTEEPTPTAAPAPTGEPIPAGYSDEELRQRAISEAKEVVYAYRSENVLTGDVGENPGYDGFDWDIAADKAVRYYDADGNERLVRYFLKDKEVYARSIGRFGKLVKSAEGTGEPEWTGYNIGYSETDAQGRKTVEIMGYNKYFYTYDQNGLLLRKLSYYGDNLSEEYLCGYDAEGKLVSEETRYYSGKEQTIKTLMKKTYKEEKPVLWEVNGGEDTAWAIGRETVYDNRDEIYVHYMTIGSSDETVHSFRVSYEYDDAGSLIKETHTAESGEELATVNYNYTKDAKDRIIGVGTVYDDRENEPDNTIFYEIKYYDNGPVMLIPRVLRGDEYALAGHSEVFLPNAEMKEMLETGNGFSLDALRQKLYDDRWTADAERFYIPSLLDAQFDAKLKEGFRPVTGVTKYLADIGHDYEKNYRVLMSDLLNRKEYPLDKGVHTAEGGHALYDGDLLTYSSFYSGGGGSNWTSVYQYDSSKRLVKANVGADEDICYKFTYQNGRVVKVVYDAEYFMNPGKANGIVNYSYDASGRLTGINGEFVYALTDYDAVKINVKQTFRLTAYTGDGTD